MNRGPYLAPKSLFEDRGFYEFSVKFQSAVEKVKSEKREEEIMIGSKNAGMGGLFAAYTNTIATAEGASKSGFGC